MLKSAQVIFLLLLNINAHAQLDSSIVRLNEIPGKYLSQIDQKAKQYTKRVSSKTEKTLVKLSKWEDRIKTTLVKVNPEAAAKLFGNNKLTFNTLLQKIRDAENISIPYQQQYDQYRDQLTTNLNFLNYNAKHLNDRLSTGIAATSVKVQQVNVLADSTEAIRQFIQERKKELIDESLKLIGRNKYLAKMNREVYYYSETLRNYKEVFSDGAKTEAMVIGLLGNIPAFKDFFKQNSMLSSLFSGGTSLSAEGLQTRNEVNAAIQDQVAAGGPNAQNLVSQNIQAAKDQLNQFKDKLSNLGPSGADVDDRLGKFKPNTQKTKTFLQRIQLGTNFQSQQSSTFYPTTTDVGLMFGYAVNDRTNMGIGSSVKIGWGRGFDNIELSTQGISLRSFFEYKIKGTFYAGGGFEYNYQEPASGLLNNLKVENWQRSGLAGISKIISTKTKFYKKTKVQLFWDFLSYSTIPRSAPIKFRIGYVL